MKNKVIVFEKIKKMFFFYQHFFVVLKKWLNSAVKTFNMQKKKVEIFLRRNFLEKNHYDQIVRTVSWELKEIKKKVTKVCSKKSYQVRQGAAAHGSKIFWKRMFDSNVAPKAQVKLGTFFFTAAVFCHFFL